jgi:hypothetical protein
MADVVPQIAAHLAWPFRMSGQRLATVEQDSIEDVEQNVRAYLSTAKGDRPLSPDFGLDDPTFSRSVSGERLAADIMEQEDRADVEVLVSGPDPSGRTAITVNVDLAE